MIVDDELSELFCKETGRVVDNTEQPYINDYIKWLESKVNNVVLDAVKVCLHPYDSIRIDMNEGFRYCNDCRKKLK